MMDPTNRCSLMQLFIAVLAFWRGRNETRFDRGLTIDELPPYSESTDRRSLVTYEEAKEEKKEKGAESYY